MSTTTITRPTCANLCWFYIPCGAAVGECREDSPKAGNLSASPTVPADYWCGKYVAPPSGSVVVTP